MRRPDKERARKARPFKFRNAVFGPLFSVRCFRSVVFGPLFSARPPRPVLLGPSSSLLFSVLYPPSGQWPHPLIQHKLRRPPIGHRERHPCSRLSAYREQVGTDRDELCALAAGVEHEVATL